MSVQIAAGEINGTRHVVRTSTGKVYVVMENGGSVEAWVGGAKTGSTYYFDASDGGPNDPDNVWTNDANAFNGLTSDYAVSNDEGDETTNELHGEGTNAPGSGAAIVGARMRVYGSSSAGSGVAAGVFADGTTTPILGGMDREDSTPGWSDWDFLDEPGGGWTWAAVQALECRCWAFNGGDDHRIYRVELEVYTHSSEPTAFFRLDSANSPACMADSPIGVDIDSDDRLHIVYVAGVASAEDLDYVTFDTVDSTAGDDLFNTPEEAISMEDADNTQYSCAVKVDSNDIAHAVVIGTDADMGIDIHTLWYDNRIGGTWADRREIEGVSTPLQVRGTDIAINDSDFPVIIYRTYTGVDNSNNYIHAVLADANDPTAWTHKSISNFAYEDEISVCVDSNGDTWAAFRGPSAYISLVKQSGNWTDAWAIVNDSDTGNAPSIVVDGTDIYVFYEENVSDDIVYNKYDGSWLGETQLETTNPYNSVKARWSYLNNPSYDTYGIDYLFDDGTNIHWGNLAIAAPPAYVPQIMMII